MRTYALSELPLDRVRIEGGFWAQRMEVARTGVIPAVLGMCRQTGRLGAFETAAGRVSPDLESDSFADSDTYKLLEGMACLYAQKPDASLDREMDALIALIAAAQQPDGYLHTNHIVHHQGLAERWIGEILTHELYNMGHLIEAGVAHFQATGKRNLLEAGLKSAQLILRDFGPDRLHIPPGHQEIEMALVRLYGVTEDPRYLECARFFLEQRGKPETHKLYDLHHLDLLPVARQRRAEGHTVRAMYQYAAMTDVLALLGQRSYRKALESIWKDLVSTKLYVTGGAGLRGFQPNMGMGLEQFTPPYKLPVLRADVDTCTVVGIVLWAHRLNRMRADARYADAHRADLIERIIYNRFLGGVSLDGTRFTYGAPLQSDGPSSTGTDQDSVLGRFAEDKLHYRKPWMGCACCPPTVARFLPAVGRYAYLYDARTIWVNQYLDCSASFDLSGGEVALRQRTEYPWNGRIRIDVSPQKPAEFTVSLRIPGWARGEAFPSSLYQFVEPSRLRPSVKLNGCVLPLRLRRGYLIVRRTWGPGDVLELDFPMPARLVRGHKRIRSIDGQVAIQRGPLLYCVEAVDNGGDLSQLALPAEAVLEAVPRPDLLGGVTVVRARLPGRELVAVPYFAWDNRSVGAMRVWLPQQAPFNS